MSRSRSATTRVVFIARGFGDDLPARVAEVALPVKLSNVPWLFVADAVNRPDEVAVGDGVRRLLKLPEIFGKTRDRGRRIKNNLRAV